MEAPTQTNFKKKKPEMKKMVLKKKSQNESKGTNLVTNKSDSQNSEKALETLLLSQHEIENTSKLIDQSASNQQIQIDSSQKNVETMTEKMHYHAKDQSEKTNSIFQSIPQNLVSRNNQSNKSETFNHQIIEFQELLNSKSNLMIIQKCQEENDKGLENLNEFLISSLKPKFNEKLQKLPNFQEIQIPQSSIDLEQIVETIDPKKYDQMMIKMSNQELFSLIKSSKDEKVSFSFGKNSSYKEVLSEYNSVKGFQSYKSNYSSNFNPFEKFLGPPSTNKTKRLSNYESLAGSVGLKGDPIGEINRKFDKIKGQTEAFKKLIIQNSISRNDFIAKPENEISEKQFSFESRDKDSALSANISHGSTHKMESEAEVENENEKSKKNLNFDSIQKLQEQNFMKKNETHQNQDSNSKDHNFSINKNQLSPKNAHENDQKFEESSESKKDFNFEKNYNILSINANIDDQSENSSTKKQSLAKEEPTFEEEIETRPAKTDSFIVKNMFYLNANNKFSFKNPAFDLLEPELYQSTEKLNANFDPTNENIQEEEEIDMYISENPRPLDFEFHPESLDSQKANVIENNEEAKIAENFQSTNSSKTDEENPQLTEAETNDKVEFDSKLDKVIGKMLNRKATVIQRSWRKHNQSKKGSKSVTLSRLFGKFLEIKEKEKISEFAVRNLQGACQTNGYSIVAVGKKFGEYLKQQKSLSQTNLKKINEMKSTLGLVLEKFQVTNTNFS